MRDLLDEYDRLSSVGAVGRAVVTRVWGSAPRPEGGVLLASVDGQMAGSVSGGCVESAAAEEVRAAIAAGVPRLATWGVTHERAWEMGLSCGGTIEVLVEPAVAPELLAAARRTTGSVVATVTGGAWPLGARVVVAEDQPTTATPGLPAPVASAIEATARGRLGGLLSSVETVETPAGAVEVFLEAFPRRPTLFIFGGVHVAMALVRLAGPLGYRTVVADGREQFLTRERFPTADDLILGWPEQAFRRAGIDRATCVCLLTHDPKFDEPALELALRSEACYVGAIGSRKTQAARRERLRAAGFSDAEVARLHGPIGLDLGGRAPEEIALAILAEITAVRHGRQIPARA